MRKTARKRVKKAGTRNSKPIEIELREVGVSDNFQGMPVLRESYFSIDDDLANLQSVYKNTHNAIKKRQQALNNYTKKLNYLNDERGHFSNLKNYGMRATKQEINEFKDIASQAANAEQNLSKANEELEKAIKEEEKTIKEFNKGTVKRSSGGRKKNRKSKKR